MGEDKDSKGREDEGGEIKGEEAEGGVSPGGRSTDLVTERLTAVVICEAYNS